MPLDEYGRLACIFGWLSLLVETTRTQVDEARGKCRRANRMPRRCFTGLRRENGKEDGGKYVK